MIRRRAGIVVGWLVATLAAVGVASLAVGLVAERADERSVQVPVALVGPAGASATSLVPPTTAPPTGGAASPPTTPPSTAAPPPTTGSTQPTPALPSTTTTLPVPPSTTSTTTVASPLERGTFVVTGGQVTAACTDPDTIELLGAVPAPGYSVSIESSGASQVKVEFEQGETENEIELRCDDGRLETSLSD